VAVYATTGDHQYHLARFEYSGATDTKEKATKVFNVTFERHVYHNL